MIVSLYEFINYKGVMLKLNPFKFYITFKILNKKLIIIIEFHHENIYNLGNSNKFYHNYK